MGDLALLVETDDLATVLALRARLGPLVAAGRGIWASVEDLVPAARTILLVARDGTDLAALSSAIGDAARTVDRKKGTVDREKGTLDAEKGTVDVEILVRYEGPDLLQVADIVGLTPEQVIAAHTGTPWQVAFSGFAPGFAYLVGGDPRLEVPRRAQPRTKVPKGAVGLAGQFSGIYPRESPGGWQLIGTTDAPLWDAERDPPALLVPGTTVRFVDVGSH